ncbi:Hyalin [Holothuria leucospilota]|uniref:Hyalin n=1 Tax=Holothuria leucospilota TaxID=206669 RepID=A0A9Q1C0K4_HOLLE|nr:Hyalin [Holothuria leucospilota]
MIKIIFVALIACVAPAMAVVTCGGDLQWMRCDVFQSTYGNKYQRTCQNQGGDSENPLDCSTGIACVCPQGTYRSEPNSETCESQCDTTPPTANCPGAIEQAAPSDSDRTAVDFVVTCVDDFSKNVQPQCTSQSGDVFSLGAATTVTCTCTDEVPLSSECSFTIKIVDETDPEPDCPVDMTISISDSANEAALEFAASCSDNSGESITASCSRALSGETLSLEDSGEVVTCTCVDSSSNEDSCTFTVTVQDETDPEPDCPVDMTISISDSANEAALEFAASCSDNSGESITASCSRALSGETLSLEDSGEVVTCTCVDSSSNEDSCTFTVTVQDETDPEPDCPVDMTISISDSANEAALEFAASCSDNSGESITASCSRAVSGETLSLEDSGEEVTCTCVDSSNNEDSCTFTVTVQDETPPEPDCPVDMTISISDSANEAALEFAASCSDNSGESITASCSRAVSGETLSLEDSGEVVTCTCVDSSSNEDSCTFTVTVQDETDPEPDCPVDMTISISDSANEAALEFAASCSDNSGESITASCSRAVSGETLSLEDSGEEVTCTCVDSSNNEDSCTFTVTVQDDNNPEISCENPDTVFVVGPDFDNVAVTFSEATCTDNSGSEDLTISCDDADDSYSIGSYDFVCTCRDSSNNTDSCTITAVVDGKPDLQCVDQTEAFTADDDPDNPLQLVSNLILPEVGQYEIQVFATPLDGTPGGDLSCTHTVTVN